ncbi:hypothetical protein ABBQ38_002870 [Trebouxia sp. C0009 RCD-2024]
MNTAPRLSGLQRQVLSLYRTVLRTARAKGQEADPIVKFARAEFERYRQVDRKNYQLIEHLMRKAKRQLSLVEQKQVTGVKML